VRIVEKVMDESYAGDGTIHPSEHLLRLKEFCELFEVAGLSREDAMKKLFPFSLKDEAKKWYRQLDDPHCLKWKELEFLFYSKFYPPHEVHRDRNDIYNFYPHDGESIAQAWGRLKSLMHKCPTHELPINIVINNFYARLSGKHKEYLDACCEGSFTRKEVEAKRDLLETIKRNTEEWDIDAGKGSGKNYEYHEPFKDTCMKNENAINDSNIDAQIVESITSYKYVNFCGVHRPCEKSRKREDYCIHHRNEETRTWFRTLDDLGKKVCALYPFICELCFHEGHFNFQCSGKNSSPMNPMSTPSLYCDDMITPNQHDELTLFLGCEELSRKTSLLTMNALDIDSVLHGCRVYCYFKCIDNTYIQNLVDEDPLPKYDRSDMCFILIYEKEKSSKISSIVAKSEPRYVEKLPFEPLPPKREKKKKKRKRSKEGEGKVSRLKHVAPIEIVDYDSELDDMPMPISMIEALFGTNSKDHDRDEHTSFDVENLFGINSESNDVSAIHVSSNDDIEGPKLGDVVLENPMHKTFALSENDDTMPPVLDNRDCYDISYNYPYETCHSNGRITQNHPFNVQSVYHVQVLYDDPTPTIINEKNISYVENNDTFMLMDHGKNVSNDSYIVEFINDATESYYERGKHGHMHLNNIKFPLFMLKFSRFHLFCLHMLVTLGFLNSFLYKTPMHRKWGRFKYVSYLLLDALFFFNPYFLCEHY
jgi:hypothetical protein